MMVRIAVVGCWLLAAAALAQPKGEPPPEAKANAPREFTPPGTKLKLQLPGEPKETDLRTQGMKVRCWRVEEGGVGYAVLLTDLPEKLLKEDSRTPEQRLQGTLTGGLWFTTPQGEPKKLLLADRYAGLEATGSLRNDERQIRMRSYLIEQQVVQIVIMGKPEQITGAAANQFMESLSLGK